ncbi:hypothetical protein LIER_40347 [Lithospermum erythrorhizon]|uniref:Integrase catalytic domain-containing protein n=1 Tax=Lithospermum erythrorhizon TaxID=34254 RepID=A0AAV3QWF2_LITER
MGKQHRVKFNKTAQRKASILELMYSDVCGPMKVIKPWEVTLILSLTLMTILGRFGPFLLKSKDQVSETFKYLHQLLERETDKLLKCIRTDNGGKYIENLIDTASLRVLDMNNQSLNVTTRPRSAALRLRSSTTCTPESPIDG